MLNFLDGNKPCYIHILPKPIFLAKEDHGSEYFALQG